MMEDHSLNSYDEPGPKRAYKAVTNLNYLKQPPFITSTSNFNLFGSHILLPLQMNVYRHFDSSNQVPVCFGIWVSEFRIPAEFLE